MKGLKKLVLASAIIAASSSAFAMQSMDDESLSATTGQDGLTITLDTNLSNLDIAWIDRDGISGGSYTHAGGVNISPVGIAALGQVITIDAGGTAGDTTGNGQLRVNISTTGTTTINLNNTIVSVGDAYDNASKTGVIAHDSTIGNQVQVVKFDATAQLQIAAGMNTTILLGNLSATEHFIHATASLPSIVLTGLTIHDAGTNGGGDIGLGAIRLDTVNSVADIDVVAGGLKINTTGTTVAGIGLENIQLGTVDLTTRVGAIGDVYITGAGGGSIAMNNVITVTGH